VQHDGGGWRYLVACPSAIIFAAIIFEAIFQRWPLQIHLAGPNEIRICRSPTRAIVPPSNAWAA
jgi:hypothetical protein